jgi:hypothetical protein
MPPVIALGAVLLSSRAAASGLTHQLTGAEAAASAGLDPGVATQVWRAFG